MGKDRKRGKSHNERSNRGSSGTGGSISADFRKNSTQQSGDGVRAIFRSLLNNFSRRPMQSSASPSRLYIGGASVPNDAPDCANHVDNRLSAGDKVPVERPSVSKVAQAKADVITRNDVNNVFGAFTEAIRDQRSGQWRNPRYHSPKFAPLLDELRGHLQSLSSVVLPPLVKARLGEALEPIRRQCEEAGDTYFKQAMDDIDHGRIDRFEPLLWMAGINLIRLRVAKHDLFADVNAYIKKTYASDPTDPKSRTFFLPSEVETDMQDTWKQINQLIEDGLIMIRETIQFKVADNPHNLIVMTMVDKPL